MFCALISKLSTPSKIIYASYSKLSKELKNGIKILEAVRILSYGSKHFLIKNRLVYLNVDAIFEHLGQFTIKCLHYFFKTVLIILQFNFEVEGAQVQYLP